MAAGPDGLVVLDVGDPARCRQIGGYERLRDAVAVEVAGPYAYVVDGPEGLVVLDVTDPEHPRLRASHPTPGSMAAVRVAAGCIYLARRAYGLSVIPFLQGHQLTLQIDGPPERPFTIEATSELTGSTEWAPLVSTNVASAPFEWVDFDVAAKGKYYRLRQP